jgi:Bacterial SH3 domain
MALRGTGFAKRPAGPVTVPASAASRALNEAEPPVHAIPLDLAPLISPYRGQGRISLRVERLPHRTRLSRGQNNGDRSWSLVLDDLEGLQFLAPKDLVGEQKLSIRVVSLDGGDGATIAVLEHSISPHDSPRITAVEGGRSLQDSGPERAQTERLRIELAEAKAARAAQEAMLADVRQGLESDWESRARQMAQVELATAKSAWEAETKEQLAELARREAANLEQSRRTWQAEEESRLAKAELEYRRELEKERQHWHKEFESKLAQSERDAKASEAARRAAEDRFRLLESKGETYERARSEFEADLAKAKAAWKESEAGRLAEAQDQWQLAAVTAQNDAHERLRREFEAELTKLQRVWKEGEANRLAAAKSDWQAQSERALAESRNRSTDEAVLLRSKAESEWKAQADARLSEAQAAWQQQSAKALADERARAEKELHIALEAAQRVWKTGETARLASAEAKWHEESAKQILEARAGDEREASDVGEINGLRDELAIANATLANRDAELAQLRQNIEHAGDGARRDVEVALADARKSWSEEEATRLAAARAQWNEQSSKELAHARTLLEASASEEARELSETREQLSRAKAALAERDGELRQARRAAEAESEQLRRQGEVALEQARDQWNAEEAGRLATVEAKWREQFTASQADKTHVEQQPSEQPARDAPVVAEPALRDSVEVLRLRDDIERLKQKMAIRDVELAQARATAEQARARLAGEPLDLLTRQHSDRVLISTGRNRSLPRQTKKQMPWRDIGIVGAVAVALFIFYPNIMALLPSDWFSDYSYSDDVEPVPAKPVAAKPLATPIESQPTDIITKAANVRSAPAKSASLVSTLGANVAVHTLERRGSWVHVAFIAGTVKQDGWVYATYLQALQTAPVSTK